MTTAEAAAALNITRRRVLALIKAGRLRAEKPGRDWMVDAASVEELKQQERPPGRPRVRDKSNSSHFDSTLQSRSSGSSADKGELTQ